MKFKFKNQDDVYLEDTGKITIHNYPADANTYSYITRIYRQYEKDLFGWKEIEGEPFYFNDLPFNTLAYVKAMAELHNLISRTLPREKELQIINNIPE